LRAKAHGSNSDCGADDRCSYLDHGDWNPMDSA